MKKLNHLWIVIAIILCLTACGGAVTTPAEEPAGNSSEQTETEAAAKNVPLTFTEENTVEDVVSFQVKRIYTTQSVEPPMPDSVYTSYSADAGKLYLVVVMDVKNLSANTVQASGILNAAISKGDAKETTALKVALLESDGSDFQSASYGIGALVTNTVYYFTQIDEGAAGDTYQLFVTAGDETLVGDFSIATVAEKKTVNIGDTISNDEMEVTVENIYFANSLYPPRPAGYYHYYEAASGKTYLIVKMRVKNLKGTGLRYSSIAGVKCTYNGKYNYSSFCVLEEDNGEDLNNYPNQYQIEPLDTGYCYFLAEIPEEAANGPLEIEVFTAGEYYYHNF